MTVVERRVVSVVFADLVGFTTLAEGLDPEDVARIQDDYFARAARTVAEHGGTTEKFIGDAVMAAFGVAAAGDDDAVRAVRAARALPAVVEQAAAALGLPTGMLRVRVGVNTGEVVVSRGPAGWRLSGDVVNTAARLQAAAEPGQVLLGPDTAFSVGHAFEVSPSAELRLRGRTAVLQTWLTGAELPAPRRGLGSLGLRAPTLGREEPLGTLLATLAGQPGREPGVLVVVAPPGAGKSRLVEELDTRATRKGHRVLTGRVGLGRGGYDPVRELLQDALGPGTTQELLATRLSRLGFDSEHAAVVVDQVWGLLSGRSLGAEPADLYAAWTVALDALDGPPPLWVVEDVHLAGPELQAFLHHIAAVPRPDGRLVVLTARPEVMASGLADLPVLHLEPLGRRSTVDLVTALVGPGTLPPDLLDGVVATAGGNPLFVEELLRSWMQAGVLAPGQEGSWVLRAGAVLPLPSTVQTIYQGQLDRLPDAARSVALTGSVPGTTFPSAALPVLGVEHAVTALGSLTRAGWLSGPHDAGIDAASYTYRHAVLRDTAYASLARARRAELHARFAGWLAAGGAGAGATELVGAHLAEAAEALPETAARLPDGRTGAELADQAAAWLERAGGEQLVAAPQRAAQSLARSLRLAPAAAEPVLLRRTLSMAEALRRSGQLQEAMRSFARAGADAARLSATAELLQAALGYESALFASRLPRSTWGAEGIAMLRAAHDAQLTGATAARSRALAALGRALSYAGQRQEGERCGAAAVALAESTGEPAVLATALLARRAVLAGPEHLAERTADARRTVAAAALVEDGELRFEASRLQLLDLLELGDLAGAGAAQQAATTEAARLGRPVHLWYPPMWAAMRALLAGDHAAAPALIEAFAGQAVRCHYRDGELVRTIQLLQLHLQTGGVAAVLPALGRLSAGDPDRWRFASGVALARAGRTDEAREHLEHYARVRFDNVTQDLARSTTLAYLAETAHAVDDRSSCAQLAELLRPWRGHAVVLGSGALCLGAASRYLGLSLAGAGDLPSAAEELSAAVDLNDRLGARALSACARAELARTLSPADAELARGLHGRARDEAADLGMEDLGRRLEAGTERVADGR